MSVLVTPYKRQPTAAVARQDCFSALNLHFQATCIQKQGIKQGAALPPPGSWEHPGGSWAVTPPVAPEAGEHSRVVTTTCPVTATCPVIHPGTNRPVRVTDQVQGGSRKPRKRDRAGTLRCNSGRDWTPWSFRWWGWRPHLRPITAIKVHLCTQGPDTQLWSQNTT